jgi:exosome complex protein LRP1
VAKKELRESKPGLQVDVAAVSRFIAAAMPDLSAEQKQALKRAGAAAGGAGAQQQPRSVREKGPRGGEGHKDAALAFLQEALAEVDPGNS